MSVRERATESYKCELERRSDREGRRQEERERDSESVRKRDRGRE